MIDRAPLFIPYVPRYARGLLRGCTQIEHYRRWPLQASVLLADVSGFTTIVERLSRTDPQRGAERLQEALNRCFGPLTAIVEAAGGEVLKFPGDAALGLFTHGDLAQPGPLGELVHRAAACGLLLQRTIEGLTASDATALHLRVVIGAGDSSAAIVGGVDGRWEFVVHGAAIDQLHSALAVARPGEVVLSSASSALAGPLIGSPRGNCFVVSRAATSLDGPNAPAQNDAPPEPLLRAFVPRPVQARIDAGQAAWLAEFRTMTVMFVNLGRPGPRDEALHQSMREVQTSVGRFGGSVNQLVADDKGTTIVVGFGVALRVHEDNPERAVKAALDIRERLRSLDIEARIGLTTGRVFTGTRGAESRLEFALIGEAVNLAARLSGSADDILCDEDTRSAASATIDFAPAVDLAVKGKSEPVTVFRPRSVKTRTAAIDSAGSGIVGREREILAMERRLDDLAHGRGGVVFIEGEAGIGKSTLVSHLVGRVSSYGVTAVAGGADSIEQTTPYLAWRPIVATLLGPEAARDVTTLRLRLQDLLGTAALDRTPLLNPMLPLPLPENAATSGLNAENRARLARDLVVDLVRTAAQSTPLLILLEDTHWMDSASWELAEAVVDREPRVLVVATLRMTKERGQAHRRLGERGDSMSVRLEALGQADISGVVCRRLGVPAIPEEMAALIGTRAEGQPLFAEELALALRDAGIVEIENGRCRLRGTAPALASFPFPETVNGVVASRIDRLSPEQQLTLKVASVLGRRFSLADLTEVHPLADTTDSLVEQLGQITSLGLLNASFEGPAASCLFSHAVVQDVAYQLMPFTQRRDLHHRAASWLERNASEGTDVLAPLLAHHWERAEIPPKAMQYLETAGDQALYRDGANREAADFFSRLLTLAEQSKEAEPPQTIHVRGIESLDARDVRLARWEHRLTQALFRQGLHKPMLPHLERCLALLRQHVPASQRSMDLEFFRGVVARLILPPRRPRQREHRPELREALLAIVRTYETLGVTAYYTGNAAQGRLALLRSVRWGERVGPSAELSRAYSTFAIVMGVFHRPKLARRYITLARTIAEDLNDRHALFVALGRGQLPLFITGNWEEAIPSLVKAIELGADVGDVHGLQVDQYQLARMRFNQGHLERALDDFRRLLADARESHTAVNQLWALAGISETLFRLDRWNDAIATAEETLRLAATIETTDQTARFEAYGVLAACWLRKEGADRAREYLAGALSAGRAGGRSSYAPQIGFSGAAEVLLSIRASGGKAGETADHELRAWLKIMRVEGFFKPILEPWYLAMRASYNRQRGRRRRAIKDLRRAIALAERMTLPYETAYARAELGRTMSL